MTERGRDLYTSNPELVSFSRTGTVDAVVDRRPAISRDARSLTFPSLQGSSSVISSVPAAVLNRRARSASVSQQTVGGTNTLLPLIYGQARVGGRIFAIKANSTRSLICGVAWCHGEVDSVVSAQINDADLPSGVTATHYTGTAGQTADSTLSGAITGYADALPGICYSVFTIPSGTVSGFPRFNAVIKGQKVSSASGGVKAWSDNPAYCLADFIENSTYGMGKAVDWTTVASVASACDALVGSPSEKKRLLNLIIDSSTLGVEWLEVLRDYAGCYVYPDGAGYRLVADTTGSSVYSFTASNIIAGTMRIEKRRIANQPTMIEVGYTDTSVVPWRDARYCTAPATPRVYSRISKPGITRYSEAVRYAVERLNEATLCDLSATWQTDDAALALQGGELVDVTHPIGLSAKALRIEPPRQVSPGRWEITGVEYDAAKFSDSAMSSPSSPDTELPSPVDVPSITGLSAADETYQNETGIVATRARITWTDPGWPYVREFRIVVRSGVDEIHTGTAISSATEYVTPALAEGTYTIEASVISSCGAEGFAVSTLVTLAGKAIAPGNVQSVSGFEVGGRVFLSWEPADNPTDPGTPDPDVWGYEIRRGTTAQAWDAATLVDRRDALRCVDEGAPAGTWRYHVKAIDSVGQYSATAATRDITVTTDSASFLVDSRDQTAPTLTNMASYTLGPTDAHTYYVTEDGVALGTKMVGALSAYTGILATHHASVTSTWLGESEDFGSLLGGQWTGSADVAALSGSITSYLGHSTDGSSWTYPAGLSQKVNARFARMKHEATTTNTLQVTVPTQNIRVDAIPRDETGTGTSSASAAVTVTLANDYVAVKKLTVTALGSTARFAVADNIVTGDPTTFDVYVFNDSGTKIASSFRYEFQGV